MKGFCNSLAVSGLIWLAASMTSCGSSEEELDSTASVAQASSVPNQTIAPGVVVSADDYGGGRYLEVRNSSYLSAVIKRYSSGKVIEEHWVGPYSSGHIGRYSVYYDATVEAYSCCCGGLCNPVRGSRYLVAALWGKNVFLP